MNGTLTITFRPYDNEVVIKSMAGNRGVNRIVARHYVKSLSVGKLLASNLAEQWREGNYKVLNLV